MYERQKEPVLKTERYLVDLFLAFRVLTGDKIPFSSTKRQVAGSPLTKNEV